MVQRHAADNLGTWKVLLQLARPYRKRFLLIALLALLGTGADLLQPLYRDPPFDAPTDPVFCFNAEQNKWFMYYTARRATAADAPGVPWIHGSNIGMAESSDGGATWTYRGIADIHYGKDAHPTDY